MDDLYRRKAVSFDAFYFENKNHDFQSVKDIFDHAMAINLWGSSESQSGEGSTDSETKDLLKKLKILFDRLSIKSLLDAPCGDFGWLRKLPLGNLQYRGMDILEDFIQDHQKTYAHDPHYTFFQGNLLEDTLPQSDLILCRDCLVHFSNDHIHQALENFKRSGSPYLLSTTFTDCSRTQDIKTGDWRPINLSHFLGEPLEVIQEGCKQNEGLYKDKSLGLWAL